MISQKLKINNNYIKLFYNKKSLLEEDLISSILPQTTQIPNSKIKIQVIPQISLDIIPFKLKFIQIGNESNTFELCGDIFSKFSILKIEIFNFFQKIFTQFNQKLNSANYFISQENEISDESLKDILTFNEIFPFQIEKTFAFLIKHQSICFYSKFSYSPLNKDLKHSEKIPDVGMFKLPKNDEIFKIIIQTYNKIIKEIEVYNSMTIGQLKDKVQDILNVSKNYKI